MTTAKKKKVAEAEVPTVSKADKIRAIRSAVNSVSKQKYAKGSVYIGSMDDDADAIQYECISTGSALIDEALGNGGMPRGRVVEIYGEESCGKTTLVTLVAANAQRVYSDDFVAIVDVEHAFDRQYARKLGIDLERLVFNQPDSAEEALDYVKSLISSAACSVVILDSVAGLRTQQQLEKGVDEFTMGSVAKLMSEQLAEISKLAKRTNTLVIFINQTRSKIGVMYGNPTTTPGGSALKFYASQRLVISRGKPILDKEVPIGQEFNVRVIKNKVSVPFLKAETVLYFGKGFDREHEVTELAISKGVILRAGAYYDIPMDTGEIVRVQGKDSVKAYLVETPGELERINELVKEAHNRSLITEVELEDSLL